MSAILYKVPAGSESHRLKHAVYLNKYVVQGLFGHSKVIKELSLAVGAENICCAYGCRLWVRTKRAHDVVYEQRMNQPERWWYAQVFYHGGSEYYYHAPTSVLLYMRGAGNLVLFFFISTYSGIQTYPSLFSASQLKLTRISWSPCPDLGSKYSLRKGYFNSTKKI